MTILMSALFFSMLGLFLVVAGAAMAESHGGKIIAALRGDSAVALGAGGPMMVNICWKSRGEERRTVMLPSTRLVWRAAA